MSVVPRTHCTRIGPPCTPSRIACSSASFGGSWIVSGEPIAVLPTIEGTVTRAVTTVVDPSTTVTAGVTTVGDEFRPHGARPSQVNPDHGVMVISP
jgi:hypothetical protein